MLRGCRETGLNRAKMVRLTVLQRTLKAEIQEEKCEHGDLVDEDMDGVIVKE